MENNNYSLFDESDLKQPEKTYSLSAEELIKDKTDKELIQILKVYFGDVNNEVPKKIKEAYTDYFLKEGFSPAITEEDAESLSMLIMNKDVFPDVIFLIMEKLKIPPFQFQMLVTTTKKQIDFTIEELVHDVSVPSIANFLFLSSPQIYKWSQENRKEILEKKVQRYNQLIEAINVNNNNASESKDKGLFVYLDKEEVERVVELKQDKTSLPDLIKLRDAAEKKLKQLNSNLPAKKQEAALLTDSQNIPNDLVFNGFYDLISNCSEDKLKLFASRPIGKSEELSAERIQDADGTKLSLSVYKDSTKSLRFYMHEPSAEINKKLLRDIYVLMLIELAKIDKNDLSEENLMQKKQSISIDLTQVIEYLQNKNIRDIQYNVKSIRKILQRLEMDAESSLMDQKEKNIYTLGQYTAGKNADLFKSSSYKNNKLTFVLNDEFPWQYFTFKDWSLLPENYFMLSENAKTLLFYLCTLTRNKKEEIKRNSSTDEDPEVKFFPLSYKAIQNKLNLPQFEVNGKHNRERILTPIEKAIDEINESDAPFFCIRKTDPNKTIANILDNEKVIVQLGKEFKEHLLKLDEKAEKKYKKLTSKHKK